MNARYVIDYHPLVEQDVFEISKFIGDFAGDTVADRKLDELEAATLKLADFPHIGTVRGDIYPKLRVMTAAEKAVICFTVDDETLTVFIVAVTYAGADWQARVAERR